MATPNFDMTALSPAELTTLLQKAGGKKVNEDLVRQQIAAGAPVGPDGKLHFIHYTAWLAAQVK